MYNSEYNENELTHNSKSYFEVDEWNVDDISDNNETNGEEELNLWTGDEGNQDEEQS